MAGQTIGRSTRRYRRLAADLRTRRRSCCRCGQPIDYSLDPQHPDAFTVDHLKSWADHPELREDPANLDAAHRRCNSAKGRGEGTLGLGSTSRAW